MPKRSSNKRGPEDVNEIAFRVVRETTNETEEPKTPQKNPAAVELGRKGGLKGGKARAKSLTASQRSEIAKKAAAIRWQKK